MADRRSTESYIAGTVHFPLLLEQFVGFVDRAYGRDSPDRFTDFELFPHRWLHLTVTGDGKGEGGADEVVLVHFDAITLADVRLFVAEAPASTDMGERFFDETVGRMQEMLAEEAALPGSSRPWRTDFFYDSPQGGVVVVLVIGEKGLFTVQYKVQTPKELVRARHLRRARFLSGP